MVGTQRASRNIEAVCDQEEGDSESEEVVSSAPAGRALPEDSAEELRDSGEEQLLQGQNDIASGTDLAGNFRREVKPFKPSVGQQIRGLNARTGDYMSGRRVSRGGAKQKGSTKIG